MRFLSSVNINGKQFIERDFLFTFINTIDTNYFHQSMAEIDIRKNKRATWMSKNWLRLKESLWSLTSCSISNEFLQFSIKWTNDVVVERFDSATQIEAYAWSDAFRCPNEAKLVMRSAFRNRQRWAFENLKFLESTWWKPTWLHRVGNIASWFISDTSSHHIHQAVSCNMLLSNHRNV